MTPPHVHSHGVPARHRHGKPVWVLSHGEVVLTMDGPVADETVLLAASSKSNALKLIRKVRVEPGTWWVLTSVGLDDECGGPNPDVVYSRTAKVLRSRPFREGVRAAVKRVERDLRRYDGMIAKARGEQDPPRSIAALKRERAHWRRVLLRHRKALITS